MRRRLGLIFLLGLIATYGSAIALTDNLWITASVVVVYLTSALLFAFILFRHRLFIEAAAIGLLFYGLLFIARQVGGVVGLCIDLIVYVIPPGWVFLRRSALKELARLRDDSRRE